MHSTSPKPIFWHLFLSLLGIGVCLFLFIPYYQNTPVAFCGTGGGCDAVRESGFSHLFGWQHWFWSLPFWGLVFYVGIGLYNLSKLIFTEQIRHLEQKLNLQLDVLAVTLGFLFSVYLTGLEAFVIFAWCSFCLIQAAIASILFISYTYNYLTFSLKERLNFLMEIFLGITLIYAIWWLTSLFWSFQTSLPLILVLLIILGGYILWHFPWSTSLLYLGFVKPILFKVDAEKVHNWVTKLGKRLSKNPIFCRLLKRIYSHKPQILQQALWDINFASPVGLAAGFDYNAELVGLWSKLGFGFASVGTLTYSSYAGNPAPRLGRLPKSKSLLVNKGFKNIGLAQALAKNLSQLPSDIPIGISIGATNSPQTATAETQIEDILKSFEKLKDRTDFAYFELNISCPNVLGSGALDQPEVLEKLLARLNQLNLARPLWVKFPAEIDWPKARSLIEIMIKYQVAGIVVSNLVKKRDYSTFDPQEITQSPKGNFSGKPVEPISNQLIAKIYQEFAGKIIIIGVGGVFEPEDAYRKIKLGANLVQLITGMVYLGPATIWKINQGLAQLLRQDGYTNITEAVGAEHKKSYSK